MSAADVEAAVRQFMGTVDQSGHLFRRDKAGIRYAIVHPILWALGWSTWLPWEYQPDYNLGRRGRVDYALFDGNGNLAVLIEVHDARPRLRRDRIPAVEPHPRHDTRGGRPDLRVLLGGLPPEHQGPQHCPPARGGTGSGPRRARRISARC